MGLSLNSKGGPRLMTNRSLGRHLRQQDPYHVSATSDFIYVPRHANPAGLALTEKMLAAPYPEDSPGHN